MSNLAEGAGKMAGNCNLLAFCLFCFGGSCVKTKIRAAGNEQAYKR
jgi:hypothetical protein